jgi:hypothetical protein
MKKFHLKKLPVILFALLTISCSAHPPPSDKSMEEKFRVNEAEFNKFVKMLKEDSRIEDVNLDAAYGHGDNYKLPLPPERMNEYRRLIKQTGIKYASRTQRDRIFFTVWRDTLGWNFTEKVRFRSKHYIYSESPQSPLFDSLDDASKLVNSNGNINAFKKISDNWYLAYFDY